MLTSRDEMRRLSRVPGVVESFQAGVSAALDLAPETEPPTPTEHVALGRANALFTAGQQTTVREVRLVLRSDGQPDITLTRMAQLLGADASFSCASNGQAVASAPPVGLPAGNWEHVFSADFANSGLAALFHHYPAWGDNNNPEEDTDFRQGVTGSTAGFGGVSASAVTVAGGKCLLTASNTATRYGGADWPYRSAWIRTKTEYLYGYFEVRAKVVGGQGLWTTLWLMPDPYDENAAWEIDIAEFPGTGAFRAHQNIHWGPWVQGNQALSSVDADYSTAFHTYGVHWEPTRVRWYIDGSLVKTHTGPVPDVPMQLICFLEVGSPAGWGTGPFDGSTPLPRATEIDYLRIWREA
jgi:hypothetical protein